MNYGNDKLTCQYLFSLFGNYFMTIERRLKEERERIGLSQPRFGEIAKVVKQTVIQWEKGVSAPDAVQLAAISEAGADVLYILTGARNVAVQPISPRQRALLDNYEHSDEKGKTIIEGTANLAAESAQLKKKA